MDATAVNAIFQNGYNAVSTYMSGPLGIVVGTFVGIAFFIMLVGMIMSVVNMFRGTSPK